MLGEGRCRALELLETLCRRDIGFGLLDLGLAQSCLGLGVWRGSWAQPGKRSQATKPLAFGHLRRSPERSRLC